MRKNVKESIGDATQLIGQPDPEEFLDPFLNTLMRDPVRLRTSGSIVDRAIANHFVLRDRKDPFNHMRLTSDMLEPLPDLANRIREWRIKKAKGPDISLSVNDVSRAVEVDSVNPDLLEALAEMERLTLAADRVESEAFPHSSSSNNTDILHNSFVFPVLGGDSEVLPLPPGFSTDPNKLRLTKDRNVGENENDDENRTESAHNARKGVDEEDGEGECAGPRWRKPNATAESSKVVEVSNRKAQVTMCSPGVGIRHFNYSKVFEASGSQDEVYGHGARDLVTSVVNGFNACFLCYGQTGSGKTHTMFGPPGALEQYYAALTDAPVASGQNGPADIDLMSGLPPSAGLVVRALAELLEARSLLSRSGCTVSLALQFIEIYNEQ
eukprot:gene3349-4148_t